MSNKNLLKTQKATYVAFEAEGLGTLNLRVLSRGECLRLEPLMRAVNKDDETVDQEAALEFQRQFLAKTLDVALEDVDEWADLATIDQVQAVFNKAMEINGIGEQSAKTAYKSTGKKS